MNKSLLKKTFEEYDLYIFDLDGTLYYQKKFRFRMLVFLLVYALKHPTAIKDFLLLKEYRKIRENWDERDQDVVGRDIDVKLSMDERQYEYVARKKKTDAARVKKAVSLFMLEAPLTILPSFRDEIACSWIERLHDLGKTVVVYSDYPVADKLQALKIEVDGMFTSADENIGCMKPDPRGIAFILKEYGVTAGQAVMIGDRYEKDGLAAVQNGVDYVILSPAKGEREQLNYLRKV